LEAQKLIASQNMSKTANMVDYVSSYCLELCELLCSRVHHRPVALPVNQQQRQSTEGLSEVKAEYEFGYTCPDVFCVNNVVQNSHRE